MFTKSGLLLSIYTVKSLNLGMHHKSVKYGIYIGLDQPVFLCLQKYANVLHDMFGLMEFLELMVQVKVNYCVSLCSLDM